MSNVKTDPSETITHDEIVAPAAIEGLDLPQQMDQQSESGEVDRSKCRDPDTGRFTKGWKGGGRPVGSRDRFSKQVLDTLQACWEANADAMLAQLAAEKPEVIMGMVSRLMPQALIAEDITGEQQKGQQDQQVTITVITKNPDEPALPAREVEGELITASEHVSGRSTH